MSANLPPDPPAVERVERDSRAPIADMRDVFARKTPQTDEDRARTQAFIDGKIELIRRDPHMTEDEKKAAIDELQARR